MLNILILLAPLVVYSSCFEVTKLDDNELMIGVSPFYDTEKNSLIYLDAGASFAFKPEIFRHDLALNVTYKAKIDGLPINTKLGFVIPFEGSKNLYAVGAGRNFEVVQWDGVSDEAKLICTQFEIDPIETNFVHLGHTDPEGRFWTETLRQVMCDKNSNTPPGHILMSNDGKTLTPMVENLTIANDFVLDKRRNILYYGESCSAQIRAQDYDPTTGALSNERLIYDDSNSPDATPITAPDGITVDEEGNLWVTGNGQSIVYQVDVKTGKRALTIPIPAPFVQSIGFGGPNFDILYAPTAKTVYSKVTGQMQELGIFADSGFVYKITGLGVKGQPESKIDMKYASCMNDQVALAAQKKKRGFKSKVKRVGKTIKELFRNDHTMF